MTGWTFGSRHHVFRSQSHTEESRAGILQMTLARSQFSAASIPGPRREPTFRQLPLSAPPNSSADAAGSEAEAGCLHLPRLQNHEQNNGGYRCCKSRSYEVVCNWSTKQDAVSSRDRVHCTITIEQASSFLFRHPYHMTLLFVSVTFLLLR